MMGTLRRSSPSLHCSTFLFCVLLVTQRFSSSLSLAVKRSVQQVSSSPNELVPIIIQATSELDEDRFNGDPILLRSINKVNNQVYYKLPRGERIDALVFRRDYIDNSSIVVLTDREDHTAKTSKRKRTFVVLRMKQDQKTPAEKDNKNQTKKSHHDAFYVTFAYIRRFLPKDDPKTAIKLGNETLRIEWDTWTPRYKSVGKARAFGWTTCTETVFVACHKTKGPTGKGDGHDYSEEISGDKDVKDYGGGRKRSFVKNPDWGLNKEAESDAKQQGGGKLREKGKRTWETATNDGSGMTEGGDVTETLDFFGDLDDSEIEARTIGAVLNVIITNLQQPTDTRKKREASKSTAVSAPVENEQGNSGISSANIKELIEGLVGYENLAAEVLITAKEMAGGREPNQHLGRGVASPDPAKTDILADIFSHMGWKTQDLKQMDLSKNSATFGDIPFVGFGVCPYVKQKVSQLDHLDTPEQAVDFYLTSLRNQCSKRHVYQLLKLFNDRLLTINGDKTLSVPSANKLATTSKLTPKEIMNLSKAYEFAMFSQVFAAEFRNPTVVTTDPAGLPISRNVFTIISMALHTLNDATENVPAHFILLSRHVVQTLKSANTKVLQDYGRIVQCKTCPNVNEEKIITENDILSLQAMQYFIKTELRANEIVENSHDQYADFFLRNNKTLSEKTKAYL